MKSLLTCALLCTATASAAPSSSPARTQASPAAAAPTRGGDPILPQEGGQGGSEEAAKDKAPLDLTKMTFNPASVKQVMTYHLDEVQACYSASLSDKYGKKALSGELLTSFVINRAGKVQQAAVVKSAVPDPKLRKCVVGVLSGMSFPAPKDGRNHPVRFPYHLKVNP